MTTSGKEERYAAVVIGTGQGGKPLAAALAAAGHRTAIVERGDVGGTCVNVGCTPTKTMVASARAAHIARRAPDYGVEAGPVGVNMRTVRKRKRDIVDLFRNGSETGLEGTEGLDLIRGEARFADTQALEVSLDGERPRRLVADRIFLNVGARPAVPPIEGLEDIPYLDSTSIMELGEVPGRLLVLGGGYDARSSARRSASSRYNKPTSLPSEVVTTTALAPRSRIRFASLEAGSSGRNVAGPFLITLSTDAPGSDARSFSRNTPSTTRSPFTTTQRSQAALRARSHASLAFSSGAHVGTSRLAASPAEGAAAKVPSVGSPLAAQSALPGT